MYCQQCGGKTDEANAKFCRRCGAPLENTGETKPKTHLGNVSSDARKVKMIALHIKWCNALFLGGILIAIIGGILQSEIILAFVGFAIFGVIYCMIAIEILVWKSLWKYAAILFLLFGGFIGIICFFIAYGDAKMILKKSGYTLGIFGPREIDFFGKKLAEIQPLTIKDDLLKKRNVNPIVSFIRILVIFLLAIGILSVLAAIIIVALNPAK
ncbi:MAG: hypothetical protein PHZ00_02025 [Candidatus Peribacteraceae bacterium]|nr:hypothetical protein [Candidatus Peribacteraceae bacterium]